MVDRKRWDRGDTRGSEVDVPRHRCGTRGLGDVLRDGMERSAMTRVTTSAKEPLISITGLSASYGNRRVLHGVDLEMYHGEVFVLLGGSGWERRRC